MVWDEQGGGSLIELLKTLADRHRRYMLAGYRKFI
jgi:hypothetical protein